MPHVKGTRVKRRLVELGRDLIWLAAETGIPYGTLRNVVNSRRCPDPTNIDRVRLIAGALDLRYSDVACPPECCSAAKEDDGVPDNPPKQPKGPKGPPRRQDKEQGGKGPKRAQGRAA